MEAKRTIWFGRPVPTTKEIDANGNEINVRRADALFDRRVAVIPAGEKVPSFVTDHDVVVDRLREVGAVAGEIEVPDESEILDAQAQAPAAKGKK